MPFEAAFEWFFSLLITGPALVANNRRWKAPFTLNHIIFSAAGVI